MMSLRTKAAYQSGSSRFGPFATREEAQAGINSSGYDHGCFSISGSADANAAAGGAPISPGDQIAINAAGQIGNAIGTEIGNEIGKALFGDPAEEARQREIARRQAIEQQRRAEEAAREAERVKEEIHRRLSGILKLDNFDGDRGGLHLKGVEVKDSGDLTRDADGKLTLKLGDDDELKPVGMRATANNANNNSLAPNTDLGVVDLRGATTMVVNPEAMKNPPVEPMAAAQPDDGVGSGEGLKKLQEGNAAYRQTNDDTPKIVYVEMPDKPERPQTLTDQAKELAKEAGDKVVEVAASSVLKQVPVVGKTKELYGEYKKMNAIYKGAALNVEKVFDNQASAAVSPTDEHGASEENSRQLNQAGSDIQDAALKSAGKTAGAGVKKNLKLDESQVVVGPNSANVVPVTQKQ